MNKFAVLLTCFNRKEKTIASLAALYKAYKESSNGWEMSIYLTDDGSTDGTSEAVSKNFPQVKVLKGDGTLYWAGGMRNSWSEALKEDYDAYLLLNDDTNVYPHLFNAVLKTHEFSVSNYGMGGVYVGTTIDADTKEVTYGGSVFTQRLLGKMRRVPLNKDMPEKCELGNANIMWVSNNVIKTVGILSKGYVHGMADYDYTMKAVKANLPVLVMPGINGECVNDHGEIYEKFASFSFKDRISFLFNPVGLDFKSQLYHMRKHFPVRLPVFYLMGWFKVIFPNIYYRKIYKSRVDSNN